MEPTEPMEWVMVDYNGKRVHAANFLDGVLVKMLKLDPPTFCPGWYIQKPTGDMDGPMFRKYKDRPKVFGIEIVEV